MQAYGSPIAVARSLAREAYCSWGSATASKIHTFGVDRLRAELEWMGVRGIEFLYGASANFGQLPRDAEIAELLADVRRRTGYPKKFFTNTAKNATERIFHISKILHDAGLAKGATLSPQTWSKESLVSIKRSNIKPKTYTDLQRMFTDAGIPTYAEIIVGLPGETLTSFCAGLDQEIEMGQHDGLAVYPCRVLPGTEMAEPEYRKAHGIVTRMTPILANHADLDNETVGPTEYEETVIATASMPVDDWRTAMLVSWFVQAFFCMGLASYPLLWLKARGVTVTQFARWFLGKAFEPGSHLSGEQFRALNHVWEMAGADPTELAEPCWNDLGAFPQIRWPLEEATWLALMTERTRYFGELEGALWHFCNERGIKHDASLTAAICRNMQELVHWTNAVDPALRDPGTFARRVVWYGRRGQSFLQGETPRATYPTGSTGSNGAGN